MATITVPLVLGAETAPAKAKAGEAALVAQIRAGLPSEVLGRLAEALSLSQAELSTLLGIPQRTLSRRLARRERLTSVESDRAARLAQVFATAAETLGSEQKAAAWLKTPNRAQAGHRPLDQLDTDPGVRQVEELLGRIAFGVYS